MTEQRALSAQWSFSKKRTRRTGPALASAFAPFAAVSGGSSAPVPNNTHESGASRLAQRAIRKGGASGA
jgi:hypothetical protein